MGFHPIRQSSSVGFSLIEVMLAIVILVVSSTAIVGALANLQTERAWTGDIVAARQVATSLLNHIQGTNWDDLNDHSKPDSYLTWARHPDADGIDNDDNYLGDDPSLPLVPGSQLPAERRRLPYRTGLEDLRIYIEYFRAQTARDEAGTTLASDGLPCQGGLLENAMSGSTATTDVQRRIATGLSGTTAMRSNHTIPAIGQDVTVAPFRLPLDETIASQVGTRIAEFDPVAIRICITWKDRSRVGLGARERQIMTLITGKAR